MAQLNKIADLLEEIARCLREEPKKEESVPAASEEPVTLEDVRKVLAEKSRNGHTDEVRELIAKYGSDRLSNISPDKYADLLAEAEVIGNA